MEAENKCKFIHFESYIDYRLPSMEMVPISEFHQEKRDLPSGIRALV